MSRHLTLAPAWPAHSAFDGTYHQAQACQEQGHVAGLHRWFCGTCEQHGAEKADSVLGCVSMCACAPVRRRCAAARSAQMPLHYAGGVLPVLPCQRVSLAWDESACNGVRWHIQNPFYHFFIMVMTCCMYMHTCTQPIPHSTASMAYAYVAPP